MIVFKTNLTILQQNTIILAKRNLILNRMKPLKILLDELNVFHKTGSVDFIQFTEPQTHGTDFTCKSSEKLVFPKGLTCT